jgi:hypothetical protein
MYQYASTADEQTDCFILLAWITLFSGRCLMGGASQYTYYQVLRPLDDNADRIHCSLLLHEDAAWQEGEGFWFVQSNHRLSADLWTAMC